MYKSNLTITATSRRQRAWLYKYKNTKNCEMFINIFRNPDTWQKVRQFALRFYLHKAKHFPLSDFSWNFWTWHMHTKSIILCVMWRFYIKKNQSLRKNPDNVCYVFYLQKSWYFALRNSTWNLWNWRKGGHFYKQKMMHFALLFILKNNALSVTVLY